MRLALRRKPGWSSTMRTVAATPPLWDAGAAAPIRLATPWPRGALGRDRPVLVRVRLARLAGVVRRGGVVLRRELVHLVVERRVRRAHPDHEDRAGPVAGAHEDVVRAGRAVEVVPLAHRPLLALDDRDAFAREHEEALLHALGVVAAVRLSRLDHVHAGPEAVEARVRRLEVGPHAGVHVARPARLAHVQDEPTLAAHALAGLAVLDPRLGHGADA